MCAARTIGGNFEKISSSYARSETGGVLNFVFAPVRDSSTGQVLLKEADLTLTSAVGYLKTTIFNATPSLSVLDVLPPDVHPPQIEDNAYGVAVGLAVAAILLAALSVVVLFVISMVYCCCIRGCGARNQKDSQKYLSKVQSICYICIAILTIIMLVFLILCTIVGFIAVGSLIEGVTSKTYEQNVPEGLAAAAAIVFTQGRLFLQDFIQQGRNATTVVVSGLTDEIKDDLATLVKGVLESLLTSYRIRDLINQLGQIWSSVESLERTANLTSRLQFDIIANISNFQKQMARNQQTIEKSLQSLCQNLSFVHKECERLQSQLNILDVKFNASKINIVTSVALAGLIDVFGPDISAVVNLFNNLEAEINSKATDLINKVEEQVNFNEQFRQLLSIWDTLNSEVVQPTTSQIDNAQPVIDKAIEFAALLFTVVGYVCMAFASIVLIIMLIYLVLCAIEASKRGLFSFRSNENKQLENDTSSSLVVISKPRGSKHKIACGAAAIAIFSIFILVIVILSTIITTILIVTNDEACRYVNKPSALRITDAALDLFLDYEWPRLITDDVIPSGVRPILQLQPPKQILDALLYKCQPKVQSEVIPLLPSLGFNNLVNVTAILEQPTLKNAVAEAENKVVDEVRKVDFASYIPKNIDVILETVRNLTKFLGRADYKESIEVLSSNFVDSSQATSYLNELKQFANKYGNDTPEAKEITTNADECLTALSELEPLTKSAKLLAGYYEEIQKYQILAPKLANLSTTLQSIIQTLGNSTAVIDPLVMAYRNGITELFSVLGRIMEVRMRRFTSQVASCSRLHLIVKSTLEITCGNTGLLNRLGGLTFILALLSLPLLFTAISFQVLLGMHERYCMYADNQFS